MIKCIIFEVKENGNQDRIEDEFVLDSIPNLTDILKLQLEESNEIIEVKVTYSARYSSSEKCIGQLLVKRI